jgi:ABC-type lipoprotein export system ATPase subunit
VLVPTIYLEGSKKDFKKRAEDLLKRVGLKGREKHKSSELSGGEIQRVAIARALVNDPEIILADEPTGNLDSKSGDEVMNLLKELNKEGKTIIIITHDPRIAQYAERTVNILDGKITEK